MFYTSQDKIAPKFKDTPTYDNSRKQCDRKLLEIYTIAISYTAVWRNFGGNLIAFAYYRKLNQIGRIASHRIASYDNKLRQNFAPIFVFFLRQNFNVFSAQQMLSQNYVFSHFNLQYLFSSATCLPSWLPSP